VLEVAPQVLEVAPQVLEVAPQVLEVALAQAMRAHQEQAHRPDRAGRRIPAARPLHRPPMTQADADAGSSSQRTPRAGAFSSSLLQPFS
jgi:hypothetical protein